MPIYEYRCSSCGYQKEYLRKVSEPSLSVCPECGKTTFSKMLSAPGFQLKGSGWYATDFKNSGSKPAAKAASSSEDKSAAKSESKESGAGATEKKDASANTDGNTKSKSEAAA